MTAPRGPHLVSRKASKGLSADSGGTERGHSRFPMAPSGHWGYCCREVEDFIDRAETILQATGSGTRPGAGSRQIRAHVFGRERGGYRVAAVDRYLDDLEDRFWVIEREAFISDYGPAAWRDQTQELARILLGRLDRPHGERFRQPSTRQQPGYSIADVDVLCDRLLEHFRSDEVLDVALVRHAVFRPAHGVKSYEEQQVDAFLDRVVELILAIR